MNERAWALADQLVERADELRIVAQTTLPGGTRVVDFGVGVPGGFGAGRALAELCMGGLGHVEFTSLTIGGDTWPGVRVWTDHPAESCMASQYAGWAIDPEGFFAMGSGPLRAKARVERELVNRRSRRASGCTSSKRDSNPSDWPEGIRICDYSRCSKESLDPVSLQVANRKRICPL